MPEGKYEAALAIRLTVPFTAATKSTLPEDVPPSGTAKVEVASSVTEETYRDRRRAAATAEKDVVKQVRDALSALGVVVDEIIVEEVRDA